MPDGPKISVVIPSFNQGGFIGEALASILAQSYPCHELIVMDGGSTDGTLDVLKANDADIDFWCSEEDEGQSDAIRRGFERATGDVLAWLNCDDAYLPGALEKAASVFDANPGTGLVYGDYMLLREPSGALEYKPKISFNYADALYAYMPIAQPSCFISQSAYESVGGLDPSFSFCMDYDLFLRIGLEYPAVHIDQAFSVFRVHDASKSVAEKNRFAAENQRAREKQLKREWTRSDDLRVRLHLARTVLRFMRERHILVTGRDTTKA